jgi:AICAR transformylase/IMP cyclohydrolase PurH
LSIITGIQQVPPFRCESFLRQKYEVERLTITEIAAQIFSSRTAVASHLKAYCIPIRPNDIQNKTRAQLKYGEAWRKRQVITHKREQENIVRMGHLRSQGFSYWKIADILNSMKVPTKTGRGRWHARAIQSVLEQNLLRVTKII